MASPIHRFPEIVKNLYEIYQINEIPIDSLRKEIMMNTGVYKERTVSTILQLMEKLGFIKKGLSGFIIISFDGRKILPEHEKKINDEIKKELKEFDDILRPENKKVSK